MTKDISRKGATIALLLVLAALLLLYSRSEGRATKLDVFTTEGGWGYSIAVKEKVVIYQPVIPAAEGRRPFSSRRDALKTGRLVRKKILRGEIPAVTTEELQKAGITLT